MEFLQTEVKPAPQGSAEVVVAALKRVGRYSERFSYPFSNPVSITRQHVPLVHAQPYWVAEKTDGVRVCLVLTCRADGTRTSVLIDRRGQVYGLPVRASEDLFHGSVFDGELVRVEGSGSATYKYLVFDVAAIAGVTVGGVADEPYSGRRKLVANLFDEGAPLITCLHPNLTFVPKHMVLLGDVRSGAAQLPRADGHASDGYMLTPENGPVPPPGIDRSTFKVKAVHTVDFLWSDGMLWFGDGESRHPVTRLRDDVIVDVASFEGVPAGVIVETVPELLPTGALSLRLDKQRPDRAAPNGTVSAQGTLQSARDAVTIEDVVGAKPVRS